MKIAFKTRNQSKTNHANSTDPINESRDQKGWHEVKCNGCERKYIIGKLIYSIFYTRNSSICLRLYIFLLNQTKTLPRKENKGLERSKSESPERQIVFVIYGAWSEGDPMRARPHLLRGL